MVSFSWLFPTCWLIDLIIKNVELRSKQWVYVQFDHHILDLFKETPPNDLEPGGLRNLRFLPSMRQEMCGIRNVFSGWLQVSTRNPKGRHRLWAMVPCTRPVHLTWYRRRWKSGVSQQKQPRDKKSPKAGFVIQQLTGLKPNRADFQNTLRRLAEKRRPDLIVEAFGEQIRDQSFALDHRDFTAGISTCGRSKLWQHACWLLHKMP